MQAAPAQCRMYSNSKGLPTADSKQPAADRSSRVDAKPIEHVSEEAAAMAKTMGEQGPDLNQGTPIEEVRHFDSSTIYILMLR